jgi:hypothetical protein
MKNAEKIKTHFMLNNLSPPPPPENRAVYEIMSENVAEPDGPQMKAE